MEEGPLSGLTVSDAMRHGVLSCQTETPLRTVASMMADYNVHSVVVTNLDGMSETVWGIVSDADLLRSASTDVDERTAAEAAGSELLTVNPEETLEGAVALMVEHDVTHLVVVSGSRPVGVLSSLDVATSLAA